MYKPLLIMYVGMWRIKALVNQLTKKNCFSTQIQKYLFVHNTLLKMYKTNQWCKNNNLTDYK